MTQEKLNEMLDEDAIIDVNHEEYDNMFLDYFSYIQQRTCEYASIFKSASEHPNSLFFIGDKAMAVVRSRGLVTSLGSTIEVGEQLAGVFVETSSSDNKAEFYLVFNEQELEDIGEVVDTIEVELIEPIAQTSWGTGYIFYDETFSFISYDKKYYELLKNSSNPNCSFNILHYM